jgi:hypothetical protein
VTDPSFPAHRKLKEYPLLYQKKIEPKPKYGKTVTTEEQGVRVVQDINTTQETVRELVKTKGRLGIKRTKLENVVKDSENLGSIWLADQILGGRVLMPLVTFEERLDGNCSYVQLGQEINDDSVFAVQRDEETKRLGLIDDLRALLTDTSSNKPLSRRIHNFIHAERARNAPQISRALNTWLGEYLIRKFRDTDSKYYHSDSSVVEMEASGSSTYYDQVLRKTIVADIDVADTPVSLNAFHHLDVHGAVQRSVYGVVARSNVLFPLWEYFPSSGETRCIAARPTSDINEYRAMMAFTHSAINLSDGQNNLTGELTEVLGGRQPHRAVVDAFGIPELIQSALKPECQSQEKLAAALGRKAIEKTYSGTVKDVNMNTTRASVSGSVAVERVGSVFQARVVAKPDALAAMKPHQIASFAYDPTEPLGDHLPRGRDAEEFAELINGFSHQD